MRAVRAAQFGRPEVLKVETGVPIPEPAKGQVLVEVKAASVNPIDTYIRTGNHCLSPCLPYTPGFDMAGVVKTVGPGVTRFKPGDRVYAVRSLSGACAEYSVADQNMMGHLYDSLTFEQGAGLGIAYYTAYRSVVTQGNAQAGQSILIHGASGGVGLACVQIAKATGLTVYGTAGTQEGIELVFKQGATAAFNHNEEEYSKKIMEATKGTGPDIIVEMMANKNIDTDIDIINKKGIILIVGSGGSFRVNKQAVKEKECKVTDISILKAPLADYMKMHEAMAEGMKAGWLQPHVGKVYPLEEAGLAHAELMSSGKSIGKRILRV